MSAASENKVHEKRWRLGPRYQRYLYREKLEQLVLGAFHCDQCIRTGGRHYDCQGTSVQDVREAIKTTADKIEQEHKSGDWAKRDIASQKMRMATAKQHADIAAQAETLIEEWQDAGVFVRVDFSRVPDKKS